MCGCTEIHTPKLVSADAEGGVNTFRLDYFGRVCEIGPVFRAEKHDTARHLNEYTSLDCEIGYLTDLEELRLFQQDILQQIMAHLSVEYRPELELLHAEIPKVGDIPKITFSEAKRILAEQYNFAGADLSDFEPEEDRLIGEWARCKFQSAFLFVTAYPQH